VVRSWSELSPGRVMWAGADAEAIEVAIDPLPAPGPAIVTYAAGAARSVAELAGAVLGELEQAALALYPAWLPGAEGVDGPGGSGVAAVRALALRKAAASDHFGPFLADLAARALAGETGVRAGRRFGAEVRVAGLARVLADSFGRQWTAIVVRVPEGLPDAGQEVLVSGCEWLAGRGGLGVLLAGAPLPGVDRLRTVRLLQDCPPIERPLQVLPETVRLLHDLSGPVRPVREGAEGVPASGTLGFPAVAGRPHPASVSERALEEALASRAWAAGRAWNQTYQPHPLAAPIRVDLLWQAERCVVEVDGPDHRRALKFADDRRRDVLLQLAGYAVLRFTDSHVLTDPDAVVRQIELFLRSRRGTTEG
jgi:very-short-patch-repair endonuclease